MGMWAWIGRHRRALKLGSVAVAFVLCVGGVALGMTSASGNPGPVATGAVGPAAFEKPSSHYVVGVVAFVPAPGQAIVRARNGRFVVVQFDRQTVVRRNGKALGAGALRRGTRVIILGEPRNDQLHAGVVTITGMVPVRQLPNLAPRATPRPATTPAPRPTRTPAPR